MWWSRRHDHAPPRPGRRTTALLPVARRRWRLAVPGLGLLLAACGFHPLYGTADAPARAALRSIVVERVKAPGAPRAGQLIHNDLEDQFAPRGRSGPPRFRLEATADETDSAQLVNSASQITRNRLSLVVTYRLIDMRSNQVVASNTLVRAMSYDVLRINYGNIVGAADARRRLARQIADEIAARLAVWFSRHEKAPA